MELTIDRLTKQYKNKIAVDRLSFSLTKGVTGLLGAKDRKSTRQNSSHSRRSRMPSSA